MPPATLQAFRRARDGILKTREAVKEEMFVGANSAPGFKRYPEHQIETKPAGVRVRVVFNGEVIADSREAIRLDENKYPPVYYLPREDVKINRLTRRRTRRIVRSRVTLRTTPFRLAAGPR